ncbi:MAG: cob(I)yrinic acid a,c-diamide adenosyltransferase [Gammaproteobacteria bacterium]|nr:MAG: cob(I)yrinic acid a,c-diamide adenosyltransferase [Gammaproteobacteria bacterium]
MGYRLSKIYTRTGDTGETGLGDGSRVPKTHPRVTAMGDVDELNSHLGVALSQMPADEPLRSQLERIQNDLFDLGGALCLPGTDNFPASHVARLERWLDDLNENLPPLKNFILPGGQPVAAQMFLARAVCRRAERTVALLGADKDTPAVLQAYLNRLSDYLFVAARTLNHRQGNAEILWQPGGQG